MHIDIGCEQTGKMQHILVTRHSALKRKGLLTRATREMSLEHPVPSKINQLIRKDRCFLSPQSEVVACAYHRRAGEAETGGSLAHWPA